MRVIGIDPGINGAVALIDTEGGDVLAIDIPTLGEGKQREVDSAWLFSWMVNQCADHAIIENVHSMPEQGVASSFKFGFAAGQLRAVIQCARVPFTVVTPQSWKKFYGLKGSDKEKSRQLALRLFPNAAPLLKRKGDHQRAEAILIAGYGVKVLHNIKPWASEAELDFAPTLW